MSFLTGIPIPDTDVNDSVTEEPTPKVRRISAPTIEESTNTPSSALQILKTPENGLQRTTGRTTTSSVPLFTDATSSAVSEKLSSTPSPSPSSPPVHSILSTPPRRSLLFNSEHGFPTPPPPKGMPELPGPPPLSSDEDEQELSLTRPSSMDTRTDFSAIKTPRPPGAWSSTPRQSHAEESTQASSVYTSDVENENELAPSAVPIPGVSSMLARTPAPPGGWLVTPAAKRPLQKVRFDTQHSHTEHSIEGQDTELSDVLEDSSPQLNDISVRKEVPEGPQMTPTQDEESILRLPPATSTTFHSKILNTPRKLPSIRVVDAFGREQLPEDMTLDDPSKVHSQTKRKAGVRILDAMDVDYSEVPSGELDETNRSIPSLSHADALARVKQGLSDLTRGLDELDR